MPRLLQLRDVRSRDLRERGVPVLQVIAADDRPVRGRRLIPIRSDRPASAGCLQPSWIPRSVPAVGCRQRRRGDDQESRRHGREEIKSSELHEPSSGKCPNATPTMPLRRRDFKPGGVTPGRPDGRAPDLAPMWSVSNAAPGTETTSKLRDRPAGRTSPEDLDRPRPHRRGGGASGGCLGIALRKRTRSAEAEDHQQADPLRAGAAGREAAYAQRTTASSTWRLEIRA